jgi:hypothetical protein
MVVTGTSRLPVYMPVSISNRETDNEDDDDTLGHDCGNGAYEKCNTAAGELVAMETDGTEKLEEHDAVSSRSFNDHFRQNVLNEQEMKPGVHVLRDTSPPVSTDNGGVIKAMDVNSSISDMGSDLTVNEDKEVEFESAIKYEEACADIKPDVDRIVSYSLKGQEEVVSVRVAKFDTNSEKFTCDEQRANPKSVKMETNSSLNET